MRPVTHFLMAVITAYLAVWINNVDTAWRTDNNKTHPKGVVELNFNVVAQGDLTMTSKGARDLSRVARPWNGERRIRNWELGMKKEKLIKNFDKFRNIKNYR